MTTSLEQVDSELARAAAISVFALNADGAWACLYSFHESSTRLSDISGQQLLAALTSDRRMGTG
jgi:hypothetical protein